MENEKSTQDRNQTENSAEIPQNERQNRGGRAFRGGSKPNRRPFRPQHQNYGYNDLREHLNEIRQQKPYKSGPPADPKYNFLSDPLRDNEDYDYKPNSYNYRGRANFRRGRSNFYSTRGYRGVTRTRGRARGYGNANIRTEGNSECDLANSFSGMNIRDDKEKNQTSPNKFRNSDTPHRGSHRYPRYNSRPDRGYRGNQRRPRRNYNNAALENIKVELDTSTGEHKYSIEKSNIKTKSKEATRGDKNENDIESIENEGNNDSVADETVKAEEKK